jgi:hypothetical protein
MCTARLVFAGALILGAVALAITLSSSPISVTRVSGGGRVQSGSLRESTTICQPSETLPRGTTAVRLQVFATTGPRVTASVLEDGQTIARGERASGWTGGTVTVAVNQLAVTRHGVTLCFSLALNGDEEASLSLEPTMAALAAEQFGVRLPGRLRVEDVRPARASWWSLVLPVARRMGLGHAASGTWWALFVAAVMLAVVLLSLRVVLRELE